MTTRGDSLPASHLTKALFEKEHLSSRRWGGEDVLKSPV